MLAKLLKRQKIDHHPFNERAIWFEPKPHFSVSRNGVFCILFIYILQERQVET
jgi:hypothetical protein